MLTTTREIRARHTKNTGPIAKRHLQCWGYYFAQCALRTMRYATLRVAPCFGHLNETWNMKRRRTDWGRKGERWRFAMVDFLNGKCEVTMPGGVASKQPYFRLIRRWIASGLAGFIATEDTASCIIFCKNKIKFLSNTCRFHEKQCLLEIAM